MVLSAARWTGTGLSGAEGPLKTKHLKEEVMGRGSLSPSSSKARGVFPGPHLVCSDREGKAPPAGTRPGEPRHRKPTPGAVFLHAAPCGSILMSHVPCSNHWSVAITPALISAESHETQKREAWKKAQVLWGFENEVPDPAR